MLRILTLATWVVACRPTPVAAPKPAPPLTLLFTGDVHGVTEPCGCTAEVSLGGIDKLGHAVLEERKRSKGPSLFVDAGNLLAGQRPIDPHRLAQETIRADVITEAFRYLQLDAVAVGPLDFAFGLEGLRKSAQGGIPWTSANLVTEDAPWSPFRILPVGDKRVGIVGLIDPQRAKPPHGVTVTPIAPALAAALRHFETEKVDLVVVLGTVNRRAAVRAMRNTPGVDVWIRGLNPRHSPIPRLLAGGVMVEPHEEAQSLGQIRIAWGARPYRRVGASAAEIATLKSRLAHTRRSLEVADGDLAESLKHRASNLSQALAAADPEGHMAPLSTGEFGFRLRPIEADTQPDPTLATLRRTFNAGLKEINMANAAPPPPVADGAAGFVGGEECGLCHDEAEAFWNQTRHAHAMQTLVERDKHFDEDCISCHVTGYRQPGGSALGHLGDLINVQCESCHGAGSLHAEDGSVETALPAEVPETVCMGCHNKKHSPKFDYAIWQPKILGPGHGQPSAKKSAALLIPGVNRE